MSFDKVPANAVKLSGFGALADANASVSSLISAQTKSVAAEDKCTDALVTLSKDYKTALNDSDTGSKKYDATLQLKATAEKAHAAAMTTRANVTQALSEARSLFLAAETGVERLANTSKAAAAALTKTMDKLSLAQKAFDKAQSELASQKTAMAAAEKVLKKTPDDKRAVKEKAAAEKEIKKYEGEVKTCGAALKKCGEDAVALKAALKKSDAGIEGAKKALDDAGAKVDTVLKLETAAKKRVDETAANLADAVKANAAMEANAEKPSERIETIEREIPLAKQKLQSAKSATADAKQELANRLDVEAMLTATLTKTDLLLGQLRTELGTLAAPKLQAPAVQGRVNTLLAAVNRQSSAQSVLEAASGKKELAGKAADLSDLILALNSLADDTTTLIKDAPGLRADHFRAELEAFYHATIKANLKKHVNAEDVKLPKTLLAQQNAADGKGWSDDAIAKAEQELTEKITKKIDDLHARGVEVAAIKALATDPTYKNLAGLQFELAQMSSKSDSTLASATTALDLLLEKQRKPSATKWRIYLAKNGIAEGSPGAGMGYHMTLKGAFLSPNIGSIDLAKDSTATVMTKMFKLSNAVLEIHATQESKGNINNVHYYFSGKYVGNPSATVQTALKKAMDDWLTDNVEPLITRAKDADGNLDML